VGSDHASEEGKQDLVQDKTAHDQLIVDLVPNDQLNYQCERQVSYELDGVELAVCLHGFRLSSNDGYECNKWSCEWHQWVDEQEWDANSPQVLNGIEQMHTEVEKEQDITRNHRCKENEYEVDG
jgi:hypothetical protein